MNNEFKTIIYCGKGRHRYEATFVEKATGKWYGTTSKALPPLGIFEKRKKKKEKELANSSIFTRRMMHDKSINANGEFFSGTLCCPNCGNKSFVKCNKCGELTCYNYSGYFKCAICGNSGSVTGKISNMSGSNNFKTSGKKQ